MEDHQFLITVKPETAKRWKKHWENGGSIKTLRSHAEQLKIQRERDQRLRNEYRRLKALND
jgi:hypothetical protein